MSNLALYLFGYIIMIAGLIWAGSLMGVPPTWLGIGSVILLGLGIITAVSRVRRPEESPADE